MKKIVFGILSTVKTFSLWGIIFLLILIFGFNVNKPDIIYEAMNGPFYLNCLCIYMIVSIVLLPVSLLIYLVSKNTSFYGIFIVHLPIDLTVMIRGFGIFPFLIKRNYGENGLEILQNVWSYLWDIIKMAAWWAIIYFGSYFILFSPKDNSISRWILKYSRREIIIRLGIILAIYFGILLIMKIINMALIHLAEKRAIETQETVIYVTQHSWKFGNTRYWYKYVLKGNIVTKVKCSTSKFFDGRENIREKYEEDVESWEIGDPKMPEWLYKFIPMGHKSHK